MAKIRKIAPDAWVRQADAWGMGCTVYVIEEPESGFCKIGIAEHPLRRWSGLQCGNPRPIVLRAVYSGTRDDCRAVERAVLVNPDFDMMRGEWLNAPLAEVIDFIDAIEAE
jgi:hypothetical protein